MLRDVDVARLTYFGLFALQHRGQESAGMMVSDGEHLKWYKEMGLVNQIFDERVLSQLQGYIAIGHTRYSTTGSSILRNAQPLHCAWGDGSVAVAHNGNLINTEELRAEMESQGVVFETTNDSEVIARMIATQQDKSLEDAIAHTMGRLRGAYSVCILTEDTLDCDPRSATASGRCVWDCSTTNTTSSRPKPARSTPSALSMSARSSPAR